MSAFSERVLVEAAVWPWGEGWRYRAQEQPWGLGRVGGKWDPEQVPSLPGLRCSRPLTSAARMGPFLDGAVSQDGSLLKWHTQWHVLTCPSGPTDGHRGPPALGREPLGTVGSVADCFRAAMDLVLQGGSERLLGRLCSVPPSQHS